MTVFSQVLHKDSDLQKTTAIYENNGWTTPVKQAEKRFRDGFPGAALDTAKWDLIATGAGQAVSVASGVLSVTTGTTISSETIIRSKDVFSSPTRLTVGFNISQKIAQNEFYIEMIGVDAAGAPTGKDIAAWRISGTDNVGAAFAMYDVQGSGTRLSSTVASTGTNHSGASVYGLFEIEVLPDEVWFHTRGMDSNAARTYSQVRHQQIPDPNALFKIQLRAKNGTSAPASTTTMNIQYVNASSYSEVHAEISTGRSNIVSGQAIGAHITNSPAVTVSGTPTVVGPAAHDVAVSGAPVRIGAKAINVYPAAVSTTGDTHDLITTMNGALINKPYAIPEADWQIAPAVVVNTTDVVLKAAGAAGVRNYVTALQVMNTHATVATEVVVKDGATVIWRGYAPAVAAATAQQPVMIQIIFPTPLKGTAATALNFACITTGANVYVNAQGYQAP